MYRGKCIHGTKDVGTIKQRARSPSPHCDTLHLKKTRKMVTYFHYVSRSSLLATGSVQLPYLAYVTAFSKITLFLASFWSSFPCENASTVSYACACIVRKLQKGRSKCFQYYFLVYGL